ncbi:MAG: hypothetical protein M3Z64_04965, partial [Verrucomicrobiota bacterium]|nr:hypothetical protein [Verrucomicrobiota bacterium]
MKFVPCRLLTLRLTRVTATVALAWITAPAAFSQTYVQQANGQLLDTDSCGFQHFASNNNLWTQAQKTALDCHNQSYLQDVSNWSTPDFPNNTGANVLIGSGATRGVHLNESVSAGNLSISNGAILNFDSSNSGGAGDHAVTFTLAGPTLTNNGSFFERGDTAATTLALPANISFTGSGVFGIGKSSITSGAGVITNAIEHTIEGGGGGAIANSLVNNGTITANGFNNYTRDTVLVNNFILTSPQITNNNLMTVTANGNLELRGGVVDNSRGTISVSGINSSFPGTNFVTLTRGASITGGTLTSSGDASRQNFFLVPTQSGGATLSNLTLSTGTAFEFDTPFAINGTITNNGLIIGGGFDFNSGSYITLNVPQNATLAGNGLLVLRGNGGGITIANGSTLTQVATHTLNGSGPCTINGAFTNRGLVDANVGPDSAGNRKGLSLVGGNFVNSGTMQASNRAELLFGNFDIQEANLTFSIDNTGGTIQTVGDSIVLFQGGITVQGGTIRGGTYDATTDTAQGLVRNDGGLTLNDVTIEGYFQNGRSNAVTLAISGTLTNNGLITSTPSVYGSANINFLNGGTLAGNGSISLAGNIITATNDGVINNGAMHHLAISGSGATISGN